MSAETAAALMLVQFVVSLLWGAIARNTGFYR